MKLPNFAQQRENIRKSPGFFAKLAIPSTIVAIYPVTKLITQYKKLEDSGALENYTVLALGCLAVTAYFLTLSAVFRYNREKYIREIDEDENDYYRNRI